MLFPVSRTYWHECRRCNRRFDIESVGGIVILGVSGAMFLTLGIVSLTQGLMAGSLVALAGVATLGFTGFLVRARIKNGIVPG